MSSNNAILHALQTITSQNNSNVNAKDNLRIVHGFVSSQNSDGTINFVSMDGTIKINSIPTTSISGIKKGVIKKLTINSDITVLWKIGTGDATIISYSHVDVHTINSTCEVNIGVTEESQNDQFDYDEYEDTGNLTSVKFTKGSITHVASNKTDSTTNTITPDKVSTEVGNSILEQNKQEIKQSVGNSYQQVNSDKVIVNSSQINLGENATENALLGTQTALLLVDFITACSQIIVPTMMGPMPITNIPQFTALIPRCEQIKSQIVKLK